MFAGGAGATSILPSYIVAIGLYSDVEVFITGGVIVEFYLSMKESHFIKLPS